MSGDLNSSTTNPADSTSHTSARSDADDGISARLAARLLPPLLAFALARVVLAVAARSSGFKSTSSLPLSRWDSAHYLSIAERGYEFFSCAKLPGFNPAEWCGNAAWFPGYPMLIRALSLTGLTPHQSGVLVSAGFTLAGLTLLWNTFLGPDFNLRGLLALALAAVFPGHVYYAALFPIAMCSFFQILAIQFYQEERYLLAGLAGFVAAFTYSTGFFLAFAFGLHLLVWRRREGFGRLSANILLTAGLTFAGFLAVIFVQWIQLGVWNAYSLVQAKYQYAFTLPWVTLLAQTHGALGPDAVLAKQAAFFVVLVGIMLWASVKSPRRPVDALLAIFALTYWLVPLMLGPGYVAVVRAESMLLPIIPLARKLPVGVLVVLVLIALLLAPQIASLFFQRSMA